MFARRIITSVSSILLSATLLAGCAGNIRVVSYTTEPEETEAAPVSIENLKVALLLPEEAADENGAYTAPVAASHIEALTAAVVSLGAGTDSITVATVPEDADGARKALEGYVSDGYSMIFSASSSLMNPMDEVSKENPNVYFANFGGYKHNSTNFGNYYASLYEAMYLAGASAALHSENGIIGLVASCTTEYPDTCAVVNAYALGAQAVKSDVDVRVVSLAEDGDVYGAVETLASCGIITSFCDTADFADACERYGKYFIAYGKDVNDKYDFCIGSVTWKLNDYYKTALIRAANGSFADVCVYRGSLAGGSVNYVPFDPDDNENTVQTALRSKLTGSDWDVFTNIRLSFTSDLKLTETEAALLDVDGNEMISADGKSYYIYKGEELISLEPANATSDLLASGFMNYLVEGITVK